MGCAASPDGTIVEGSVELLFPDGRSSVMQFAEPVVLAPDRETAVAMGVTYWGRCWLFSPDAEAPAFVEIERDDDVLSLFQAQDASVVAGSRRMLFPGPECGLGQVIDWEEGSVQLHHECRAGGSAGAEPQIRSRLTITGCEFLTIEEARRRLRERNY